MVVQDKTNLIVADALLSLELISVIRKKVPIMPALQPLATEQAEELALVLSEHLTNILQHNHSSCRVSILIYPETKLVSITDNGKNIATLLDHVSANTPLPDPLSESGRGLWLMRHYFPSLRYQREKDQNILFLPLTENKPKLVLIDDDPIQLALLEAWLQNDYHLEGFTNPLMALSFLQNSKVDLIISDVRMPELDGLSLRKMLLENEKTMTVPFLFLSALDDEQLINKAAELSIDDFITKPISERLLKSSIKRVLHRNFQLKHSVDVQLEKSVTNSLWSALPKSWHGWQLDLAYLVASKGGGDFVFQQQRQDSLIIILGDVMGHGLQAKFFSFAISGYLHGLCYALTAKQTPSELLTELSAAIAKNTLLQCTLVTALVFELFNDGRMVIACAGHPAPFFSSADGDTQFLPVGGVLPGLQHDAVYKDYEVKCNLGDRLLAFTDGLAEQFPNDKSDKINALPTQLANLCLNAKMLNLQEFIKNNTIQPLPDDVTLLAISRM